MRGKLQGKQRPAPARELLTASEESKESLGYALSQLKNPSQVPPAKMPTAKDSTMFLSQLRGLSHRPDLFSKAAGNRLSSLGVVQIAERTLLVQEIFVVLNYSSPNDLKRLLNYEQQWFAANFKKITDKKSLHNYIQELVKTTARSHIQSEVRLRELKKIAQPLKKDAFALRSFRFALVANSEWEITDIFDNIPHDLKLYVQGKRK